MEFWQICVLIILIYIILYSLTEKICSTCIACKKIDSLLPSFEMINELSEKKDKNGD